MTIKTESAPKLIDTLSKLHQHLLYGWQANKSGMVHRRGNPTMLKKLFSCDLVHR